MREPAVFCYPKCGHYAYYQTSRHPRCPKCGTQETMYMVRVYYMEFMRISYDERDKFLSKEILKTNPSLITRLTEPHRRYNSREIIVEVNNVIMDLDVENKTLSDTVKQMHDTIWKLIHEKRESGQDKVSVYGVHRDRQPSEKFMEETMETEQTKAACSEAAAANISRTTTPEREQEEQLATNSKKPNLKNI